MSAYQGIRQGLAYVGRRGTYLLFLCLLDAFIAYSLLRPPPLPLGISVAQLYAPFIRVMPLLAWGLAWGITGVLAFAGALWHRLQPLAFPLAASIKVVWGMGYIEGYLEKDAFYNRGYQTGLIYLTFAGITLVIAGWQENLL